MTQQRHRTSVDLVHGAAHRGVCRSFGPAWNDGAGRLDVHVHPHAPGRHVVQVRAEGLLRLQTSDARRDAQVEPRDGAWRDERAKVLVRGTVDAQHGQRRSRPQHVGDRAVPERPDVAQDTGILPEPFSGVRLSLPALAVVESRDRGVPRRVPEGRQHRHQRRKRNRRGVAPPKAPLSAAEASASTVSATMIWPRRLTVRAGLSTAAFPVPVISIASARNIARS